MDVMILTILIFTGVAIFGILIARPITLWWFKINEVIRLFKSILMELEKLNSKNW